jgi:hypothetical protein
MAAAHHSNTEGIFLDNPDKWDDWSDQFQAKAIRVKLWTLITAETDDGFHQDEPEPPEVKNYEKRRTTIMVATRSQSTQSTETMHDDIDPTGEPASVAEMTTSARQAYTLDWNIYTHRLKKFTEKETHIENLTSWVLKTVSQHYRSTACRPDDSLRTWYKNLEKQVGISTGKQREKAREAYKEAVRPLSRLPKDLSTWLEQWERAINKAQQKEVPEAKDATAWTADFFTVMKPFYAQWVITYKMTRRHEIESGTLTFRELANDFRDEVKTAPTQQGRIAKGAFGPSFADQDDHPSTGARGGQRAGKRRYTGGSQPTCLACGQFHALSDCFYVFRDKAPKWFRFRKETEGIVANRLEEDENLKKEVLGLKGKKIKIRESEQPDQEQD